MNFLNLFALFGEFGLDAAARPEKRLLALVPPPVARGFLFPSPRKLWHRATP